MNSQRNSAIQPSSSLCRGSRLVCAPAFSREGRSTALGRCRGGQTCSVPVPAERGAWTEGLCLPQPRCNHCHAPRHGCHLPVTSPVTSPLSASTAPCPGEPRLFKAPRVILCRSPAQGMAFGSTSSAVFSALGRVYNIFLVPGLSSSSSLPAHAVP